MSSQHKILQRMNELATKAASELNEENLKEMDTEYQQLLEELDRQTSNQTATRKSVLGSGSTDDVEGAQVFEGKNLTAFLDHFDQYMNTHAGDFNTVEELCQAAARFAKDNAQELLNIDDGSGVLEAASQYKVYVTNGDIIIETQAMTSSDFGLKDTNLLSSADASDAMTRVQDAIDKLSLNRAYNGAMQNRLEYSIENIQQMKDILAESISRITDADMAEEMMNYTREQILAQVSAFVVSQEKVNANSILSLLD